LGFAVAVFYILGGMDAAMKKILLAGASGRLGTEVLSELGRRGYAVRALVRDPARLQGSAARGDLFVADARAAESLRGACDGADVVVSTMGASLALGRTRDGAGFREVDLGANLNLLSEAKRAGVGKFVYVSLHGAEGLRGLGYVDAHEEFVAALATSGLDYTILRPTGFFYVFEEIFKMASERGRVMLVGDGSARTNPIHEADLARECADAVEVGERETPVGGPETYTRREIAELAFEALGRRPRITSLPPALVRAMIAPVRLFDRRLYDFLAFGVAVSTVDVIAPPAGRTGLRRHFRRLAGIDSGAHSIHFTNPGRAAQTG
jgi:uncharacterized protein YbjT (DUF2867 family)